MKPEYELLISLIDSLPGIKVIGQVLDKPYQQMVSGWGGPMIFFHSNEKDTEGLFFLTRCLDNRYWQYGHTWRIELSVGDSIHHNGDRPLTYHIFRPLTGIESEETLLTECRDLISNMCYHYNHEGFMTGFGMNKKKYNNSRFLYSDIAWDRKNKLEDLGI